MGDLVDLKYSAAEQKEEASESMGAMPGGESEYPWGMCITLEKRELDRLGIQGTPGIGDEWHMMIIAEVTSVNMQSGGDAEDSIRVGLQITMAQVTMQESAEEEKGEAETPAAEMAEMKS